MELVHADALEYLPGARERFDVIIVDFPDPTTPPLARLYHTSAHRLVARVLRHGGVAAIQSLGITTIRILSFGAEECGLHGSRAYVRDHRERRIAEGALLVNLDGILDPAHLTYWSGRRGPGYGTTRSSGISR